MEISRAFPNALKGSDNLSDALQVHENNLLFQKVDWYPTATGSLDQQTVSAVRLSFFQKS